MKKEKINGKQKKLFIVGALTFVVLILGATYAYFQVGTSNLFGTSTINAQADSMGTVIMQGTNANLQLSLTAVDMMRGNSNINYYATPTGKSTNASDKEHVIARAYVSPSTDTNMYHCTYDLNITHSGTNDMYSRFRSALEGEEATATGDMYGIKMGEYDTKALCEADELPAEYIQYGFGTCELFGSKYSFVLSDVAEGIGTVFSSQSECEQLIANSGGFSCFKKYEAGDTYIKVPDVIYQNISEGQIILTINGTDYDWFNENDYSGMPSTVSGEFDIMNPQEIELTAGLRFINRSDKDQTALAGTDVTISITASNLSCTAVGLDVNDLEDNNVELAVDNTQSNMSIGNNVSGLANTNNNVVINDLTIRNDEYTINKLAVTEQYKYYATPNGKTTTETLVPIATLDNNNNTEMTCTVDYQIITAGNMLEAVQELDSDTILDLSIYTGNTLYNTYHKNSYPSTITIPVIVAANSSVILKSKLELSRVAEESDIESLYDTSIRMVYVPTSIICSDPYSYWTYEGTNVTSATANKKSRYQDLKVWKKETNTYIATFANEEACTNSISGNETCNEVTQPYFIKETNINNDITYEVCGNINGTIICAVEDAWDSADTLKSQFETAGLTCMYYDSSEGEYVQSKPLDGVLRCSDAVVDNPQKGDYYVEIEDHYINFRSYINGSCSVDAGVANCKDDLPTI